MRCKYVLNQLQLIDDLFKCIFLQLHDEISVYTRHKLLTHACAYTHMQSHTCKNYIFKKYS